MNRKIFAALAVLTATLAAPARAGETSGLSLGLRAAYGVPIGDAAEGTRLSELATGAAPVQLEAGWRFDEHWLAGVYFAWGPTFLASGAEDALEARGATDVSGHFEQRLGIQGIYSFSPVKGLAPWAGLGLGYEWTRYADAEIGGEEVEVGLRGFEATLQAGAQYPLTSRFSVGPFAAWSVGQYRSTIEWTERDGGVDTDADRKVEDRSIHQWLQLGLRGSFDL